MTAAWRPHPGGIDAEAPATPVSPDLFKAAMGRLAHTISIVTTLADGRPFGLIATSVASVSAEPPTLLVCVDRASASHDPIAAAGKFCLNVLAPSDQLIAEQFASPARRAERFTTGAWAPMVTGAPALASAEAAFDCAIVQAIPYHSHTIFLGVVQAVQIGPGAPDPLVYQNRRYQRLAPR